MSFRVSPEGKYNGKSEYSRNGPEEKFSSAIHGIYKNKISSRAPTPHKMHFISRFWEEISGTTVSAATSIMEAVTTENTPSPLPPAMDTIKVIRIGTSSRAAMTIPALYARFRSFWHAVPEFRGIQFQLRCQWYDWLNLRKFFAVSAVSKMLSDQFTAGRTACMVVI